MTFTPNKMLLSVLIICALVIAGCSDNSVPLSSQNSQEHQPQTDNICASRDVITFGQHYEAGSVTITTNSTGVTFAIESPTPYNVRKIHIKVATTTANPGAPGQFPIHINNPVLPNTYTYTWAQLGMTYQTGKTVYFFLHFDSNSDTGWAGSDCLRSGKWYCYIPGTMCQ